MLSITNLTCRIGDRLLLDKAALDIAAGQRVGLVGRNGAGKTTLFRLIAGELAPESGEIGIARGVRIGMVDQEAPGGTATPLETVLAAATEPARLLAEAENCQDAGRLGAIHDRLAVLGAHAGPARAAAVLAGLGFDEAARHRPLADFSGGWRMRVALAGILFAEPDLLLLDEPTNHLDLEAAMWLTRYLAECNSTLLVVSHDRSLLNAVAGRIVHLEEARLRAYTGNYDQFHAVRQLQRDFAGKALARQMARRQHMQSYIDRFRYKADKARQAQSRIKALARMPVLQPVTADAPVRFDFPEPASLPPPLLEAEGCTVGYDRKPVLRDLSFRLDMGDRIALLGRNGNGKSTLVRLLAGRLAPLQGRMRRHPKLVAGYFSQDQTDELPGDRTPFQLLAAHMPAALPKDVRTRLGGFGFPMALADTPVSRLSGGERARLLLALTSHAAPQLLLLDEPTNHLDMDRRDALVRALVTYPGAVVLVTHDLHLARLVADRLWLVADGRVSPYDGDLDDYRRLIAAPPAARPAARKAGERRRTAARAARAATLGPIRRRVRVAEKKLDSLTDARTRVTEALAADALPPQRRGRLADLLARLGDEIGVTEAEWIEAQEALERHGSGP